jgi:hypothetical protein
MLTKRPGRLFVATTFSMIGLIAGCSSGGGGGASGSTAVAASAVSGSSTSSSSSAPAAAPAPVPAPTSGPAPQPTVQLSARESWVDTGGSTTLSWSSQHADSCTASGGWSGNRQTAGSVRIGPIQERTTYTLSCSGPGGSALVMVSVAVTREVVLSWMAPTQAVDGSPLPGLSGYRIYVGHFSRNYSETRDLSAGAGGRYTLALPSGEYYIAMTAIGLDGQESSLSNEIYRQVN